MFRRFFMALPCLMLVACGQSMEDRLFYEAARRQYALDNEAILIFARGPTWDGGNASTTAKSPIDSISKSFVPLLGLADPSGPLQGFKVDGLGYGLRVQYSPSATQSPLFKTWAGREMSWNSKEFKAFMLYAHLAKVQKMVFDAIPALQTLITDEPGKYPLKGNAYNLGHVLDTAFSYTSGPTINFYQHNKTAGLEKLNMVDEADAAYHEFAHYIQYLFNSTALNTAITKVESGVVVNPDLDAIIEGTADFLSAAVTRSERIHVYLENNMPLIKAGSIVREGTHNRSLSKSWNFPETYIYQSHMDGRVVASAVNDIRKYLSNQSVPARCGSPIGASTCQVSLDYPIVGVSDLWIKSFEISMLAFENLTSQSTFRDYARKLIDETEAFMSAMGCTGACLSDASTGVRADVAKILIGRGLMEADVAPPYVAAIPAGSIGTAVEKLIRYSTSFDFVPFAPEQNLSDGNASLSECEMAIVFPDITNNTNVGTATDLYNIYFRVVTTQNLNEVKDSFDVKVDHLAGPNRKWKSWGILKPGERGYNNLATPSSAWFKTTNGSHFSEFPSVSNFPVNWGYIVSVPEGDAGEEISITWEVVMYPKNASSTLAKTSFQMTQTRQIESTLTFCSP